MLRRNFLVYKMLPLLMKRELILLVLHSLLGPVVMVLLGKVQGVVWTATVVGILMFINKGLMTFIDVLKEATAELCSL